jgi:quercetin dioxygenase-like cupin family protein
MASNSNPDQRPPKDLRALSRYITTHSPSGHAIFSTAIPAPVPVKPVMNNAIDFSLMYTTSSQPAQMSGDKDIAAYAAYLADPPSLTIPNGSVGRIVDYPPGYTSPMHRTLSLDMGIVIEGEIELVLDSGETRLMKRGDLAVQRGTNHAWRNASAPHEGRWARMFYVLQDAEPIELADGKKLVEDLAGITRH